MSVPSVSVTVHDRYTPELRDRIVARLRTSMDDRTAYRLLTPGYLRDLAKVESPQAPVLSVYLRLGPDRRVGNAWRSAYSSLITPILKRINNGRARQELTEEFGRIEHTLHDALPTMGRGAAFFVCRPLGLWRQIALPLELPDGVHMSRRPYIRPLVRTQDEHDRFVLVILSQEHSRFFISQIGVVEEVFQVRGDRLHQMLSDRVPRDRLDVLVTDAEKIEAKVLAHVAEMVLSQFEGRYLLVSAQHPALRAAFMEQLSKGARQRVCGAFSVEIHARPAEVATAAEPAQRAVEERKEVATIQRIIDAAPNSAAWGERPTLEALYVGRVMTLAVDDMFTKPGARCGNCAALWETVVQQCPNCGSSAVEPVEDVVELALEKALVERAALELVRSDRARQLLRDRGPMAALLR
ncbi:baeRF10 domain-containing protein [Azospirillum endophyticum]